MVMNKDEKHLLTCVAETRGETGGRLRMKNSVLEILSPRWHGIAKQTKWAKERQRAGFCVTSIKMELTPLANVESAGTGTCFTPRA